MKNDLCIGLGPEVQALTAKFIAKFSIVINFPVIDEYLVGGRRQT
jgi:hypothetical protein